MLVGWLIVAYGLLAMTLGVTGKQHDYPVLGFSLPSKWGPPLGRDLGSQVVYCLIGLAFIIVGAVVARSG